MMVLQGRRTFVGSEILYAEYRTAIMLLYYRSRFKKYAGSFSGYCEKRSFINILKRSKVVMN